MENDLHVMKNIPDPVKRDYETSTLSSISSTTTNAPKKSRKKLKKKKKRPKHQQTSTTIFTTTSTPETSPSLTTTDTWLTTSQWQFLAERLFRPLWQQNTREEPKNIAKMPRPNEMISKPLFWEFIEQNKPKNDLKTMKTERTSLLLDFPRESNTQSRSLNFGKVNTYQPLYLQDSKEFTSLYDQSADSDRSTDYYSLEADYPRLHYTPFHEFLHHRNKNDYQDDSILQTNNLAYNQEYVPSNKEFATSESWPDLPYKYSQSWSPDERTFFPMFNKWPTWRQQDDFKYRPERGKYMDKNYWVTLQSEKNDDMDQAQIEWQQQQPPFWEADRMNWQVEETLKRPSLWPQTDRMIKSYEHQPTIWEKSKNHSELNKKEDTNDKIALPKITMRTWNSLTSDPATWPYKLPSAKPWPKDENGKSYNPNADLVKKLGLDRENNVDWSQNKDEEGRLVFEKQTDSILSKDASKKKELTQLNYSKYKPISNKSSYSDYKKSHFEQSVRRAPPDWLYQDIKSKEWIKPQTISNTPKKNEVNNWNNKFEMPNENQVKSVNSNDENSSLSRLWPFNIAGSKEQQWLDKHRDGLMKPWENSVKNDDLRGVVVNNGNSWKQKSNNSWLPKTKEDFWMIKIKSASPSWSLKAGDDNLRTLKADNGVSWMLKPSVSDPWLTNGNTKFNSDSWLPNSNNLSPWIVKGKTEDSWSKSSSADSWSRKTKDNNSWADKFNNIALWKNNDDDWSRKAEQYSWHQKMNDDWNIDYGKNSASTWPSKWKQFAYHKVTTVPISKPGTTADVSSPKSKNAFVAVSAISSSANYNGNDWRKNDVEKPMREDNLKLEEADQSGNLQPSSDDKYRPIYMWKKDGSVRNNSRRKSNSTEQLENQLEALKQDDIWPYKENQIEIGGESMRNTTSVALPTMVVNFTTSQLSSEQITSKTTEKQLHNYQREILVQ